MTKRWEYLTLIWMKSAELKTKPDEDAKPWEEPREIRHWSYTETYYIRRPDEQEDEKRPGKSTDVEDSRSDTVGILNELGQEGWEIVDRIAYRSAIGESMGWPQAGSPIEVSWLMKRESKGRKEAPRPHGRKRTQA